MPTNSFVAIIARNSADRLVADGAKSSVFAEVEMALHDYDMEDDPGRYFDPIGLGGLIVSIASLAWSIYQESRSKGGDADPSAVEREVRVRITDGHGDEVGERESRIIEVVVREATAIAGSKEVEGSS